MDWLLKNMLKNKLGGPLGFGGDVPLKMCMLCACDVHAEVRLCKAKS